ncbi:hypothetical protein, partial [Microbacterium sp. ZXX196]|uniref:hypothetical protein n=1 Tax=Microbacterium sp. ZXX196 TaxID=2609291 RepID=UPI001E3DA976
PESPNNRIIASPITKGGVIIGNTLIARIMRRNLSDVRVTKRAKIKPSIVVKAPTIIAITREFIATPQRPASKKHATDHIRLSVNFSKNI